MSVQELRLKDASRPDELIVRMQGQHLNIVSKNDWYIGDREQAHLLYLYLKERFEP